MIVYDETKTTILNEYDLTKGYLKKDTIVHHIDEIQAVEEQGHYETIAEYSNGGKDVKYVVDVKSVEYQEAHDVEEEIQVYIRYTDKELRINDATRELDEIKSWFTDNDWIPNKITTGEWSTSDKRWINYLAERKVKRNRQDELNALLEVNK